MGGGEYNNLGHHLYVKRDDGTYDEVKKIKDVSDKDYVMDKELEEHLKGVFVPFKMSFSLDGSFWDQLDLLFTLYGSDLIYSCCITSNNYRKMHHIPMRRKAKR